MIPYYGKLVAVGFANGTMSLYSSPEGDLLLEKKTAHPKNISRLAFNVDGTLLVTGSADNTAKIWRISRDKESYSLSERHQLSNHQDTVHAVAFSPDGHSVATASYDGQVGIFAVKNGKGQFFAAHDGKVGSVSFSPKNKQLLTVGGDDFKLRLWDLSTSPPTLQRELAQVQDKPLWATLSPDGKNAAAVGREQVVSIYSSQQPPPDQTISNQRLIGHEETVFRAIFSPDGQQLATASADMTVRVWDLSAQKELFCLCLPTEKQYPASLWDFDFHCPNNGQGDCWIAVPLTVGRLALYRLPYAKPPQSLTNPRQQTDEQ